MNPTLPLWVLLVGAVPTAAHAPPAALDVPKLSTRWSTRFALVPAPPAPRAGERSFVHAERIEALLAAAQVALGSLRPEEARSSLSECEALLRAHPELPQAAWLAAERAAIAAELASSEDSERMQRARRAAAALEGPRAPAFHEGGATAVDSALPTLVSLRVRGLAGGDELEWDGLARPSVFETPVGEHHLRVVRGERLLWASWVQVAEGTRELDLNLPPLEPCSADDLGRTRDGGVKPLAAPDTACPRWAVARVLRGAAPVAFCARAPCTAFRRAPQTRAAGARGAGTAPRAPAARGAVPAWTWYVAGGVGAALLGGLVAAEAGAFSSSPSHERWRYEGLR